MSKVTPLSFSEERKLLKLAKEGKKRERERAIHLLLSHNANLVKYLAKSYSVGPNYDRKDLEAEGMISLVKAIEKFDLSSKNSFSTYAGYWVWQYIRSFIQKNCFIKQTSASKDRKSVIYYDSDYQNKDKENKSYSLADTLDDIDESAISAEQIRQKEAKMQVSNLFNSLENHEAILVSRLYYRAKPNTLVDIYCMATDEEKKQLERKLKVKKGEIPPSDLEDKKIKKLPIVKKYCDYFSRKYKSSELAKLIKKPEAFVCQLKQDSSAKLKELAEERNLHFLIQ